jgi:signal transduction histidine kinase
MSGTMEDFMSFYRPNKQKERFCVCEAVDKALEIIRPDLPEQGITLEYTPMYDYHVHGYMNEYTQVVVSLLTNAKDLLVHRHIEGAYIRLEIFEEEGEVILAVSDNAGGMKPENLARIFEPYFTTKHQSSGTGLGLYIAKMIIENSMGGHLSGENIPEGARFTIALQRSDDA